MSNAMLSLLGMYSWNDTLFDDMSFPASFTQEAKEVFVNTIPTAAPAYACQRWQ